MPKLIQAGPTLLRSADYRRVYDTGIKLVGRYLILFVADTADNKKPGEKHTHRVGITVSTKIGNSVTRNLIRRRLKESLKVRDAGPLVGHDAVFIAIRRITSADFEELGSDIDKLMARVSEAVKPARL